MRRIGWLVGFALCWVLLGAVGRTTGDVPDWVAVLPEAESVRGGVGLGGLKPCDFVTVPMYDSSATEADIVASEALRADLGRLLGGTPGTGGLPLGPEERYWVAAVGTVREERAHRLREMDNALAVWEEHALLSEDVCRRFCDVVMRCGPNPRPTTERVATCVEKCRGGEHGSEAALEVYLAARRGADPADCGGF